MTGHPHSLDEAALRAACGHGRVSAQRLAVARAAARMDGAFTVDELHRSAEGALTGIGLATTYRAVAALTGCGTLAVVGERDGGTLYVWCANDEHHHHVICTACGAVAGVDCPLPEGVVLSAANDSDFTVTRHELTLYGLCGRCRRKGER